MRIVVALLLLLPIPAMAQATIGARLSGLYTETELLGDRLGIGLTGFGEVPLSQVVSFGADIGYIQGGFQTGISRTSEEQPDVSTTDPVIVVFETRVHSLTVAPTVAAQLPRAGVRPMVSIGPRLDLRLAERSSLDGGEAESSTTYDSVSYGGAVAAGIRVPLSGAVRGLRADVRYSRMFPLGDLYQNTVELRVGVDL